ncbi:MAG: GAF domain-containing protein [Pyrinomonadaceae bacterium]
MKKQSRTTRPAPARKKGAARKDATPRAPKGQPSLEDRLRTVVNTVDVAHALTMPLIRSIESLLYLAARALGSGEASVLVRDGNRGGLKFLVAIGAVADKLLHVRIPPGKGIAGFVFASGQPLVVADVRQESAFYSEVDRVTGYSTQTILATPLQCEGETVGVLEFINRLGTPPYEPFSPNEMDWAARFADAIATLVDAHESAGLVEMLFLRAVVGATAPAGGKKGGADKGRRGQSAGAEAQELRRWLKRLRAAPEHRELLSLAVSVREIAAFGDAERRLCRDILDGLARWTDERRAGRQLFPSSGR